MVGDGGFGHVWSELETLVRERIPIVLVVLNNGVLGYQKDAKVVKFGRYTGACHFQAVDHAAIAEAYPSLTMFDDQFSEPPAVE